MYICYIEGMALRERTVYLKIAEGALTDTQKDGGWVDVNETKAGGAEVSIEVEMLDFLDIVYARSLELANELGEFSVELSEDGRMINFWKKDGSPLEFDKVMRVLFD